MKWYRIYKESKGGTVKDAIKKLKDPELGSDYFFFDSQKIKSDDEALLSWDNGDNVDWREAPLDE